MASRGKLSLVGVVLAVSVLAALPFHDNVKRDAPQRQRRSHVRWRQAQASVPAVPVREGEWEDDYGDNRATQHAPTSSRIDHPVAISGAVAPPRLPEDYRPILKPEPVVLDDGKSELGKEDSASEQRKLTEARTDSQNSPEKKVIRHRIRDGDTLQALAARYLGDPQRYREIYETNKDKLPSDQVLPLNLLIEIYVPR